MAKSARADIKRRFGQRVRDRRLSLDMSQEELASEADIRRALISEIERGEANPTLESVIRIATALRISLSDLFEHQ
ncbi:helix-turn-helix transcriptional regulator [Bradyrhizobium liaoningense]|uniref:helix-turn-helix transcriptional regulator n=1 Tax=Bradyrhizobium liaoningense TaxID=43992 RepID=UPI001BADFEF8|nr:helix-turn-helix transcriptional regulator [Bradyrhizobium liaoningense]MBR0707996.1 helix-turn-helix transcriptional regulator [Bradyrhizobium liaoningense]